MYRWRQLQFSCVPQRAFGGCGFGRPVVSYAPRPVLISASNSMAAAGRTDQAVSKDLLPRQECHACILTATSRENNLRECRPSIQEFEAEGYHVRTLFDSCSNLPYAYQGGGYSGVQTWLDANVALETSLMN